MKQRLGICGTVSVIPRRVGSSKRGEIKCKMRGGGGKTTRQAANVSMVAAFRGPTEIGRSDAHGGAR